MLEHTNSNTSTGRWGTLAIPLSDGSYEASNLSPDPAGASKRSTYYETNSYEQEELSLLYVSSETLTTNLYFEVR